MRKVFNIATPAATVLVLAGQLFAGGFWLTLGNPDASAEARKANAVLTIKAAGCHDPANATVTATAVGFVDGQRQSIPLKLTRLSEPGSYALAQQWPKEGRWVLQLVARNGQQFTNTLVAAGPEGVERHKAKYEYRQFTSEDVDALLRSAETVASK